MNINLDHTLDFEDVNAAIKEKLQKHQYRILSYTLRPVNSEFPTDHQILQVLVKLFNEKEPKIFYFFLKFFPVTPRSIKFAKNAGGFKKEQFTYEDLFHKIIKSGIELLDQCTAKHYLSVNEKFLVLEDLTQYDYVRLKSHSELDFDTAQLVLKELAKLHASSLIYEENISIKLHKPYRLIDDNKSKFAESFYNDGKNFINYKGIEASIKGVLTEIDYFKQAFPLRSGNNFKTIAEECCYKVFSYVKPSEKYRNVLSHGNLWLSNILLKFDESRKASCVKFVDFQTTRYVPPSHDVMAFLHLTTSRKFRQNNLYKLLGLYYNYLEAHLKIAGYILKKLIPFNDFLHSCEDQKAFAITQAATYFQITLLDDEAMKYFFGNDVLSDYTFNRDRSLIILTYINKNEFYKRKLMETILDLRDYCDYL